MQGPSHTDETAPITGGVVQAGTTNDPRPGLSSTAPQDSPVVAADQDAGRDAAVLAAGGIEKSYRRNLWSPRSRVRVLTGAEMTLEQGEVVGLVGENGSGKSTLMRILVGDLRADAGTVTRSGQVGYCPQEPLVYPRLTCDEHFELFGRAYSMSPERERMSRAAIYDSLGFERFAATRADQLSGGTLAKLNLGLALLPDPAVLLLDEPYAGFDWDTYLKFWDLVDERRAAGRTVLIVSHFVVDEARFDRIVEIREGRTWAR